jgi:acetyl esterase/lipase
MLSALLFSVTVTVSRQPLVMPESIAVTKGIIYQTRGITELKIDAYLSTKISPKKRPAILFLHGGAWRDGRRDMPNPVTWQFAELGYAAFQCDYRLSQEAVFPAQLHDVRSALRWIKANADRWNIDPEKIGVWGMSAGGHLALLTAYSSGENEEPNVEPIRVNAVGAIFPTTDILQVYRYRLAQKDVRSDLVGIASPEYQLLGGDPERMRDMAKFASPTFYVSSDDPPTWLVHGYNDDVVPIEQSRNLLTLLTQNKVRSQLVILSSLRHEAKYDAFQSGIVSFFQRELGPPQE